MESRCPISQTRSIRISFLLILGIVLVKRPYGRRRCSSKIWRVSGTRHRSQSQSRKFTDLCCCWRARTIKSGLRPCLSTASWRGFDASVILMTTAPSSMTASGIRSHTPIFPRAGINRSFLLRSAERRRDGPGRRPRRGRRYCDFSPMPRRTGTEPLRPLFVCDGLNHLLRATPIGCIADGAAPHPVQLRPGRNVVIGERTVVWTVLKRRSVGQRG